MNLELYEDTEPRDTVSFDVESRERIMDGRDRKLKLGSQKIKWFSFNVDTTTNLAAPRPSSSQGCLGVRGQSRRPSFLYRSESQEDLREFKLNHDGNTDFGDVSINVPDIAQQRNKYNQQADGTTMEEQIVTPFARILHRLHNVRIKYAKSIGVEISKESHRHRSRHDSGHSSTEGDTGRSGKSDVKSQEELGHGSRGREILEELDWCLEHLENLQTHKSMADLASTKFKRILNKELSHLAESGKGGSQIKDYLSTFIDNNDEENDSLTPLPSDKNGAGVSHRNGNSSGRQMAPMSKISVSKTVSHAEKYESDDVPKYGIDGLRHDSVDPLMVNIDVWGIDIFKIDHVTNGHSLTAVTYTVLKERDLLSKLSIAENEFVNFIRLVESHYHSPTDVLYHNQIHAADVTQGVHALLSLPSLQDVFSDMEQLAVIVAGAIHDIDHPGVTNQYLINTGSELALMYNDESVLENHSLAVAFKLMQHTGCDIFKNFSTRSRHKLRKMIIDLVLATDMSKHMSLLAELKTMVETGKESENTRQQTLCDNSAYRFQVLQSMIHGADLSNPTKPLEIYNQWTDRIMQEFFKQGDTERELKLEISAMCDRHTATVEKSQIGFIDYIVQPLWETWAELVYPDCSDILDTLEENRQWYQNQLEALSSSSPSSPASSSSDKQSAKPQTAKP